MIVSGSPAFPAEKPVEPFAMAREFFRVGHHALDGKSEEGTQLQSADSSCRRQR